MRPDRIEKEINVQCKKDSWEKMTLVEMLEFMVTEKTNYAFIKNAKVK